MTYDQDDGKSLDDFMPSPKESGEDLVAYSGEGLSEGITPASQNEVVEALRTVYDPEIPVNIFDLGLIYEYIVKKNGDVSVLYFSSTQKVYFSA